MSRDVVSMEKVFSEEEKMKEDTRHPAINWATVASGSNDVPEDWWRDAELIGSWRMAKVLPLTEDEIDDLHTRKGLPVETVRKGYMAVNRDRLAQWLLERRTGAICWNPPKLWELKWYPDTTDRLRFVMPDQAAEAIGTTVAEMEKQALRRVIPAYWIDDGRLVLFKPDVDRMKRLIVFR